MKYTLIICVAALAVFLLATNPAELNVGLLVVPVVLLFLITFCVSKIFMDSLGLVAGRPSKKRTIALVTASFLTIVMILQSTGGMSGIDLLLLGLIIIISGVYISKF